MSLRAPRVLLIASFALALSGCGETLLNPPTISAGWAATDQAHGGAADASVPDAGTTEVCDGVDNDGDGAIDEDLPQESCTISGRRGNGTTRCILGRVVCQACTPGETKKVSCGCNQDRTDVCLSDGSWMEGSCDGCKTVPQACELCIPGERIVRRCDSCPDGGDCGSNCVGSIWECKAGCKWEQITNCQAMTPTCSGDMSIIEACGNCGTRKKACDGCFWDSTMCTDQGSCKPGTVQQTPCFKSGCAAGTYNTSYCSSDCKWNTPTQCQGCVPGVTVTNVDCIAGHPQCGQRKIETTCVMQREQLICGGDEKLPIAQATSKVLTQCPTTTVCTPGTSYTQPCTDGSGTPGTKKVTCGESCTWDIPDTCTPGGSTCPTSQQCTPSTTSTTKKACGPNACGREYEETRVCNATGCTASVTTTQYTACPECTIGQTKQIPCTTGQGQCGSLTVKCGAACSWEAPPAASQCVASPYSCVPGSTKIDYVGCGGNSCGRTYPRTMVCLSNGCGYQFKSEDKSVCPSCTPDQTETTQEMCRPGTPSCGYVQRKCDASTCEWRTLPCPVCG